MASGAKRLSDATVRNAKPKDKSYRLADGGGLHLFVAATGGKFWRYRYHVESPKKDKGSVEKLLSLGQYPAMTLAQARTAFEDARTLLRNGSDPGEAKKAAKELAPERTFEAIARSWHRQQRPTWTEQHAADVLKSLVAHIFPTLGECQIDAITPPMVLKAIRAIEARPAIETAKRVRQRMSAVFVFAIASGIGEKDPASVVAGALLPLVKGRQPAVTDLDEARVMLAKAEAEPAFPITKLALRFLALTSVRPGEVRGARWDEFEGLDGADPVWRVPAERMKMKRLHVVALSTQAVEVLTAARILAPGELVFPMTTRINKPISENAIGYLLNRAGYHGKHVPHGWRVTFSTVMNEAYPQDRAIVDLMLAHVSADKTEAAYNRAEHMARRRVLAQAWADMLLKGMQRAAGLKMGARRSSPGARAEAVD